MDASLRNCLNIIGILALLLAVGMIAGCEEEEEEELAAEEQVGVESTDAVQEVMSNVMGAKDSNPSSLTGSASRVGRAVEITRRLPGLGPSLRGLSGAGTQAKQGPFTETVDFAGSYNCTGGGTVSMTGKATHTYSIDPVEPIFYQDSFVFTGAAMTMNSCAEEGYTMSGTVTYNANDSFTINQQAAGSSIFNFDFSLDEDASANITAVEQTSGKSYTLALTFDIAGTLQGQVNAVTGEDSITSVNITGTVTVNGQTCTGTWTNPNQEEPNWSC
jgi:hypothetical protein